MNKVKAIERLRCQADALERVVATEGLSPEFNRWRRDTEVAIEKIFGDGTRHIEDFKTIQYSSRYGDDRDGNIFRDGLANAASVLESFLAEIDEYWESDSLATSPSALARLERICNRFHLVALCLRSRFADRDVIEVKDEYDVQYLIRALLLVDFEDIRDEEVTPSHAGASARMDFLLKGERIVLETKKTRKGLAGKQVGEELLTDIARYRKHPDCGILVCFVYDPESHIKNPRGLEADLTGQHGEILVKVIVAPKGI